MRNRLFGPLIFDVVLLSAVPCFSQGQNKIPTPPTDKSVEWVDIRVPKFPPLARQARIFGTVAIEVRFKGCELDPASPNVVSGHPMLAPAAMESLKQSTFRCGDFADSTATVYYEFGEHPGTTCESRNLRLVVAGSHVRVLATTPCVEP
jgi:hypothetical protein